VLKEMDVSDNTHVHQRLTQIKEMFNALDIILNMYLQSEETAQSMLNFFKNFADSQKSVPGQS
jgi:hypothetical protein